MLRAAGKESQAAADAKLSAKLETEGKQLAAQAAAKKALQPEAAARTDNNLQRENTEPKRRGFRIFR